MNDLESLQRRIADAFQRIEQSAERLGRTPPPDPAAGLLAQANARLTHDLGELQARRAADAGALDQLVARLKPLLNEV